ncbi:MAG: cytochrome b/b6 domain-containing protein [Chloroflexi bacterium]|nr:cytochrome b/b6 domain-containing protein [Chloroflexota bacterium]
MQKLRQCRIVGHALLMRPFAQDGLLRSCSRQCRIVGCALLMAMAWAASAADGVKNSDCLECHADKDLTKEDSSGRTISLFVDEAKFASSRHGTNACASCHSDLKASHPDDNVPASPVRCAGCHENQSESYGASAHGLALQEGKFNSATCKDCHGAHDVLPLSSPASPLHRSNLAKTCGDCHPEVAREVEQSVHGLAVAAGVRDAPTCTDCHFEHRIEPLKATGPLKIAEQVCSRCHASERMNTKYKLPPDRVKTFFESYHGLAAQFGSTSAANCASCHGVHNILPSSDPRSTIHPDHLVETCGKCHPGVTENFAIGKVHLDDVNGHDLGSLINRWVRRLYLVLIFGVVGLMLAHNGLAWAKKALASYRSQARSFVRMDASQRAQHFLLAVSFILLALSGFALKYPESWLAWLLGSDETIRRWTHRAAGVVLLALGAYHLFYVFLTTAGRQLLKDMFPVKKDVLDVAGHIRYLAGQSAVKPRIGRFGYVEKMEYWAVVWGTIIMGITGLLIWFKVDVTRFLPRWGVDVAVTIHYYEAILACLAIFVWHFYHVIFDPDVYPLNWACWDGKVSEHWYREEHPLDDRLLKAAPPAGGNEEPSVSAGRSPNPPPANRVGENPASADGLG